MGTMSTKPVDLSRFDSVVAEGLEAFKTDSVYAEEMARQASILRARQDSSREKARELSNS